MIKYRFFTTARQSGKSVFNEMVQQLMQAPVTILTQAQVDGATWYTVRLNLLTIEWIRQQDKQLWVDHVVGNDYHTQYCFDIHEKLYTMLMLKWK